MIEIQEINKSFGENEVLKNISFNFERGKTNLIIGESGSGKTTLLRILIGLHKVDSGKILYDGRDFSKLEIKDKRKLRQEIGVLFQRGALYDFMNVEENIMFPLTMFTNQSDEEKIFRVNDCLKRVNLENCNKLLISELSGGMIKRVSIARAIVMNPKYLLCDEPNSGLDPKTAIIIDKLIKEITVEYDITTVINTHDMNSVMEIGDKIIFLVEGKKIWEGTNTEILDTDDQMINDFVYSSELFKKVKLAQKKN